MNSDKKTHKAIQDDNDYIRIVEDDWVYSFIELPEALNRKNIEKLQHYDKKEINKTDIFGKTLLHLACLIGNTDVVKSVIKNRHSNLELLDYESGWNCLHTALFNGNLSCAKLLIEKQPNLIKVKDREGLTPFDLYNKITGLESRLWYREEISEVDHNDIKLRNKSMEFSNTRHNNKQFSEWWQYERGGSSLYMFGSNANQNLGFADLDDRAHPDRMKINRAAYFEEELSNGNHIPPRQMFTPIRISDVKIAKLHTVILTADPRCNIFVCGIGSRGRLGLGDLSTQLSFKPVKTFSQQRIVSVALGTNHTVAITSDGDCYTWGYNKYNQLGYATENEVKKEPINPTPRKVSGELKRLAVKGCAASKIHTVVFTSEDLFMWGLNIGQMGIISTIGEDSVVYHSGTPTKGRIEALPHKISNLPCPVVEVSCNDFSTVCLLSNGEVFLYTKFSRAKVSFNFISNESKLKSFDRFEPRIFSIKPTIVKVVAKNPTTICALSSHGEVYNISVSTPIISNDIHHDVGSYSNSYSSSPPVSMSSSQLSKLVHTSIIWKAKNDFLIAVDVDIGSDGSIIICSKDGGVWRSKARTNTSTPNVAIIERYYKDSKFSRIPRLSGIVKVCCNPSFSSFAAIRDSSDIPPLLVPQDRLLYDLHKLSPLNSVYWEDKVVKKAITKSYYLGIPSEIKDEDDEQDLFLNENESMFDDKFLQCLSLTKNTKSMKEQKRIESSSGTKFEHIPAYVNDMLHQISKEPNLGISYISNDSILLGDNNTRHCDVCIKISHDNQDQEIWAHQTILETRSETLLNLIRLKVAHVSANGIDISSHKKRKGKNSYIILKFSGIDFNCLIQTIYFIYTGLFIPIPNCKSGNLTRVMFSHLADLLKLSDYNRPIGPQHLISSELRNSIISQKHNFDTTDVLIEVENGKYSISCHSAILSVRSEYFNALFSSRWYSKLLSRRNKLVIDINHLEYKPFEIAIDYIYGHKLSTIFDDLEFDSVEKFLSFVLDIIAVSNELLLDELKAECEIVLADFIDARNVGSILVEADDYSAYKLKSACLFYIYNNAEYLLLNNLLDGLDDQLLEDIDNRMYCYRKFNRYFCKDTLETFFEEMHLKSKKKHLLPLFLQSLSDFNLVFSDVKLIPGTLKHAKNINENRVKPPQKKERKSYAEQSPKANNIANKNRKLQHDEIFDLELEDDEENSVTFTENVIESNEFQLVNRNDKRRRSSAFTKQTVSKPIFSNANNSSSSITSFASNVAKSNIKPRSSFSTELPTRSPLTSKIPSSSVQNGEKELWPTLSLKTPTRPVSQAKTPQSTSKISSSGAQPQDKLWPTLPQNTPTKSTPASQASTAQNLYKKSHNPEKMVEDIVSIGIPVHIGSSRKISQKERRKLSATPTVENPVLVPTPPTPITSPWKLKAESKISSVETTSAFPKFETSNKKKQIEVIPSLGEAIREEELKIQRREREKATMKGIEEIRQEEQFEKWWREESERVQREMGIIKDPSTQNSKRKTNKNKAKGKDKDKDKSFSKDKLNEKFRGKKKNHEKNSKESNINENIDEPSTSNRPSNRKDKTKHNNKRTSYGEKHLQKNRTKSYSEDGKHKQVIVT